MQNVIKRRNKLELTCAKHSLAYASYKNCEQKLWRKFKKKSPEQKIETQMVSKVVSKSCQNVVNNNCEQKTFSKGLDKSLCCGQSVESSS